MVLRTLYTFQLVERDRIDAGTIPKMFTVAALTLAAAQAIADEKASSINANAQAVFIVSVTVDVQGVSV